MNILLGVSTSIAAHRALDLASALRKRGHVVRAVLTENVQRLITSTAFDAMTGQKTLTSVWGSGHEGDMDHLAATKWADAFAIAPASANALATLAHGIAADALGTFAVAWNKSPLLIAPAMNPEMWRNAAVQANVRTLRERGHEFIGPVVGPTACGDVGLGRLAPVPEIENAIIAQLEGWERMPDLTGRRILITGGPTREFADAVRFISNPSTGRMALALAAEASLAGATVQLVLGPCELAIPDTVSEVARVTSAEEMRDAVLERLPGANAAIFCAAVSDWKPAQRTSGKMKKEGAAEAMALELTRTPDVAVECAARKSAGQVLVGFAAEAEQIEENARQKLHRKSFDLIFANPITESAAGFGAPTNRGTILRPDGTRREVPSAAKRRVARVILRELDGLLPR